MLAFIKYQEALPKAIEQIRGNLREQLPSTYIDLGVNTFGGYATFFHDDVPKIFAEVDDKALQERLAASNAAAIKATQEMADWLKAKRPQATEDFALGAERFARMLHATERVDLPLAELQAAGEADIERKPGRARRRMRELRAGRVATRMRQAGAGGQAAGRAGGNGEGAAVGAARFRAATQPGFRFPGRSRRTWRKPRPSTAGTSPTSRSRGPTR
jgi:hypothetical protein